MKKRFKNSYGISLLEASFSLFILGSVSFGILEIFQHLSLNRNLQTLITDNLQKSSLKTIQGLSQTTDKYSVPEQQVSKELEQLRREINSNLDKEVEASWIETQAVTVNISPLTGEYQNFDFIHRKREGNLSVIPDELDSKTNLYTLLKKAAVKKNGFISFWATPASTLDNKTIYIPRKILVGVRIFIQPRDSLGKLKEIMGYSPLNYALKISSLRGDYNL